MDSSQTRKGPPHVEHWLRAERLCEMKIAFLQGGRFTVEHWMRQFNVTRQQVNRDLTVLSTKLGVALVCEQVWYIMDKEGKVDT